MRPTIAAVLWLLVVMGALAYLGLRLERGLTFQTDMMALLPGDERDPAVSAARAAVARAVSQQVVLLVGHERREAALAAATGLARGLEASGMVATVTLGSDPEAYKRLGALYFPYRFGLLSRGQRASLRTGRGDQIVDGALAQVFGLFGVANGGLLAKDPFLLMPAFLLDLPLPKTRLVADRGMLAVEDGNRTWVFVSARIDGGVYSLSFQQRFVDLIDGLQHRLQAENPGLEMLRTGAIFYAHAGGQEAMGETSLIGGVSLAGTVLLVLAVFRGLRPLVLSVVAIVTGIGVSFAACLAIFGELHVAALLFGVSLIGIAVDYSFQYFCESLNVQARTPGQRLRNVLPGVVVGLATTLIGYLTLLLAPFPGLHQIAVFSVIGLSASFLTVLTWFPVLDRAGPSPDRPRMLALTAGFWAFWHGERLGRRRLLVLGGAAALALTGAWRLTVDDDVHHFQALSPSLKRQETDIQRLTGVRTNVQFLVVQGADMEEVLRREETLLDLIEDEKAAGTLANARALAQFVPSAARQRDNRRLVDEALYRPFLADYLARIGLVGAPPDDAAASVLTPEMLPPGQLDTLLPRVDGGGLGVVQLVVLEDVTRPERLRALAQGQAGVRYMAISDDASSLFGEYRRRAVGLLTLSLVLMLPILAWRYGLRVGLRALAPPVAAIAATPLLLAWLGVPFTFFNAIALVMVLSIGVDYTVFCLETSGHRRPITLLAVLLSALTTLLSFGLLAFSGVFAVSAFGLTMLVGISLAFLLSPLAVPAGYGRGGDGDTT